MMGQGGPLTMKLGGLYKKIEVSSSKVWKVPSGLNTGPISLTQINEITGMYEQDMDK